ncbi:MAG: GNAT family N-acetyltransferase [Actinomycetota bacterium]
MNEPAAFEPAVIELTADGTHALRRSVLRHDTPTKEVVFAEDDLPGTWHLGLAIDREVVATSSWVPRAYEGAPAVQLRGMATARHLQGRGHGGLLLEAGCIRAQRQGAAVVWARARDAALVFYEHHGFEVVGDGFVDEATRLPHHLVVRRLPN